MCVYVVLTCYFLPKLDEGKVGGGGSGTYRQNYSPKGITMQLRHKTKANNFGHHVIIAQ